MFFDIIQNVCIINLKKYRFSQNIVNRTINEGLIKI